MKQNPKNEITGKLLTASEIQKCMKEMKIALQDSQMRINLIIDDLNGGKRITQDEFIHLAKNVSTSMEIMAEDFHHLFDASK